MGHQNNRQYAEKHPGKTKDNAICNRLAAAGRNGAIDCAAAHRIAKQLKVSPTMIGVQIDLAELRISRCQLGLFGYGPGKKRFDPDIRISEAMRTAILNGQEDGQLSCRQCWDMAKDLKISRAQMGSACERLEIRIKPCQLGAF